MFRLYSSFSSLIIHELRPSFSTQNLLDKLALYAFASGTITVGASIISLVTVSGASELSFVILNYLHLYFSSLRYQLSKFMLEQPL